MPYALVNIFESIPNIEKLCLINTPIPQEVLPYLTSLLKNNRKLKALTLSDTRLFSVCPMYNAIILTEYLSKSNLETLRLLTACTNDLMMGLIYKFLMKEMRFPKSLKKLVLGFRDATELLIDTTHEKAINVDKLVIHYYNDGKDEDKNAIISFIEKHTQVKSIIIKEIWCIRDSFEISEEEKMKRSINFNELKIQLCAGLSVSKITFIKDYAIKASK